MSTGSSIRWPRPSASIGNRDGRLELAESFGRPNTLRTAVLKGLQLQVEDVFGS